MNKIKNFKSKSLNSFKYIYNCKVLFLQPLHQKYRQEIKQNVNLNDQLLNSYSKQQYVPPQNQTFFMNFMNGMYKGDACNMAQQFSSYVNGGGFNITECSYVKDNIFSKGIIGGITWINYYLQQYVDVINQQNSKEFAQQQKLSQILFLFTSKTSLEQIFNKQYLQIKNLFVIKLLKNIKMQQTVIHFTFYCR
ncbi:hypothetical protein ABPG72_016103 [Tetrahymena utriculariae]